LQKTLAQKPSNALVGSRRHVAACTPQLNRYASDVGYHILPRPVIFLASKPADDVATASQCISGPGGGSPVGDASDSEYKNFMDEQLMEVEDKISKIKESIRRLEDGISRNK
jgi:hypothetical protein